VEFERLSTEFFAELERRFGWKRRQARRSYLELVLAVSVE
jgi:hypothetical protein